MSENQTNKKLQKHNFINFKKIICPNVLATKNKLR